MQAIGRVERGVAPVEVRRRHDADRELHEWRRVHRVHRIHRISQAALPGSARRTRVTPSRIVSWTQVTLVSARTWSLNRRMARVEPD